MLLLLLLLDCWEFVGEKMEADDRLRLDNCELLVPLELLLLLVLARMLVGATVPPME